MKKFILLCLVLLCAAGLSAKELKVLMIGNSFSNSVRTYFPKVTAASGKHKLILASASIGGCSLERHCRNIDNEAKDPKARPYSFSVTGEKFRKISLSEALKYKKWDIVTIQQVSRQSFLKEKTYPEADKLIAFVRKLAPQAEIVIQQTWAYRSDHGLFRNSKGKLSQEIMYKGLVENYNDLAAKYKLRIIPVGTAVQLYRQQLPVKPVAYKSAQIKALKKPQILDLSGGDPVGYMRWIKKAGEKEEKLLNDVSHLNPKGAFLQGCVWFMTLFNEPASAVKLTFKADEKNTPLLIKCAEEAVKQYKK